MKKIILALSLLLFGYSTAFADGTYWNGLAHQGKIAYVVGYRDGDYLGLSAAKYICQNKTEEETNGVNLQIKRQKVVADNINIIVSGIDKFYSDYANQKLPLPIAVSVVVSRLLGQSEAEIIKYIQENRKEFNSP